VDPAGAGRDYAPVPADDGTAVVQVRDPVAGLAVAVRVVRDDRPVHRSGVTVDDSPEDPGALFLQALRQGTATPDPSLVAEAAARVARPLGVDAGALAPRLVWSAELTRTGGLGSVVVVTGRAPGGGLVVSAHGRVGTVGGGSTVPCATTTAPYDADPAALSLAFVCSVSEGDDIDRTWLVVTAPPGATGAEVLDDGGGVLDVLRMERGGSMTRTPEDAVAVRLRDADGGTVDVVPVAPSDDEPFGDYGDG
jgi:hypothetical protein